MQATENMVLVTLTGKNATIDLLNDRIIITKLAKVTERSSQTGEQTVEILYSTITSTKIEHDNLQIFTASISKSITFSAISENAFQLFRLELDRLIQTSNHSLETLLMLEKMGELKDKGLITEEEFNAKKQQVLGKGVDPTSVENIKKAMESALISEEEEKDRLSDEAENAQKKQLEENRQGRRLLGIVLGSLWLLIAFIAFVIGCIVNGLFMLLTAIVISPLIHFLIKKLSNGRIKHVPLMVRVILVLVTMALSTGSYYRYQSPAQLTAKAEEEQQRLDSEKMKQEQQEAEKAAKQEAEKMAQKRSLEDEKEASAKVDKMIELGFVSKIECMLEDTAYINPEQWASIDLDTKQNVTRILMDYCSRHGGSGHMFTLKNEMDGKELGSIGLFGFHVK